LLAILGLGLLVRLYVLIFAPRPGFVIDEAEYYQIASILADGRGWMFYEAATWVRPPLYIMLLAGVFKLFGPNLMLVRLLQIGLSLASVYLLYRLGAKAYNRKTGLLSGLLAAMAWPFAVLSSLLLSETLFIFLFLLSISFLTKYLALAKTAQPRPGKWVKFMPQGREQWLFLVGGGIGLGLSALTRGQVLSFIPFIGLWLVYEFSVDRKQFKDGSATVRRDPPLTTSPAQLSILSALLAFGIIIIFFVATITPWAGRNYTTYGRPFIDTTGGYNFYLGALTGRNGALVSRTLEAVKNQSERELLGYRKGLEYATAHPGEFVTKGLKESLDFWQINFGADERLEKGYTKGLISPRWLIPDGLLDDLLYIMVGTLAAVGLVVAPGGLRGIKSFSLIWLGYNLALAFAFFAVSRFRLPVYYFFFLFAAYTLANWGEVRAWFSKPLAVGGKGGQILRYAAGLVLPGLFLALVLPSYSPDQSVLGIQKWTQQQNAVAGDELRRQGRYSEALIEYAKADQNNPYTQIGIGLSEAGLGRYDDAIGRIGRTSQDIAEAHLALGAIYLMQENREYAHSEFNSRQISLDPRADEWAWDNLPAKPLPDNRLELGEFDWGYVAGFQGFEKDKDGSKTVYFRWTAGRGEDSKGGAKLRFPAVTKAGIPKTLELRLKGYRPENLNSPLVEIRANGQSLGKVQTGREWENYTVVLPPDLKSRPDGAIIIELEAATFVPGATSRRELGVMVQSSKLN